MTYVFVLGVDHYVGKKPGQRGGKIPADAQRAGAVLLALAAGGQGADGIFRFAHGGEKLLLRGHLQQLFVHASADGLGFFQNIAHALGRFGGGFKGVAFTVFVQRGDQRFHIGQRHFKPEIQRFRRAGTVPALLQDKRQTLKEEIFQFFFGFFPVASRVERQGFLRQLLERNI